MKLKVTSADGGTRWKDLRVLEVNENSSPFEYKLEKLDNEEWHPYQEGDREWFPEQKDLRPISKFW